MSTFICKNNGCKLYNQPEEILTNNYKMIDGKLVSDRAQCPCCGAIREEHSSGEDIPLSEKNISIGEYSSLSKEGRTAMLKKRSHEHYNKKIKGKKQAMINEAVRKFNE